MATTEDAELILKLYDLRREAVCREARKFFVQWNPGSGEEAKAVATDFTRPDNAYIRQATTYWEMAFSIANTGAVDEELFAKNCGEGILMAMKCQHLAKKFPGAWTRTMAEAEAFIAKNAVAKQKAEMFQKRFAG
jgi:hypothetical protein